MTNSDYLKWLIGIKGYSDEDITAALAAMGLNGAVDYVSTDFVIMIEGAVNVLVGMMGYVKSESEGGYSKTYSSEGILYRLNWLNKKYGVDIPGLVQKPTLQDKSYLW